MFIVHIHYQIIIYTAIIKKNKLKHTYTKHMSEMKDFDMASIISLVFITYCNKKYFSISILKILQDFDIFKFRV